MNKRGLLGDLLFCGFAFMLVITVVIGLQQVKDEVEVATESADISAFNVDYHGFEFFVEQALQRELDIIDDSFDTHTFRTLCGVHVAHKNGDNCFSDVYADIFSQVSVDKYLLFSSYENSVSQNNFVYSFVDNNGEIYLKAQSVAPYTIEFLDEAGSVVGERVRSVEVEVPVGKRISDFVRGSRILYDVVYDGEDVRKCVLDRHPDSVNGCHSELLVSVKQIKDTQHEIVYTTKTFPFVEAYVPVVIS